MNQQQKIFLDFPKISTLISGHLIVDTSFYIMKSSNDLVVGRNSSQYDAINIVATLVSTEGQNK